MKNIKERFLQELLVNKDVKLKTQYLKMYHNRIFPCAQTFIDFLSTDSTEKMISLAKDIIASISYFSSYPLASFAHTDLLNIETNSIAKTDYEFVAQDHFIHSVNVYLLGIYLFFNHELFHERLNEFFKLKRKKLCAIETQAQNTVKSFISAWKYFAFSHDTGYLFEKLLDTNGKCIDAAFVPLFAHFQAIPEYTLFELNAKSLSRLILCRVICGRSINTFSDAIESYVEKKYQKWNQLEKDGSRNLLASNRLDSLIAPYRSYQRIPLVSSYEGLKHILPILDSEDFVQVIKNNDDEIMAINICTRGTTTVIFEISKSTFSDVQLWSLQYIGCEEFPLEDFSCEYYSKNLKLQIHHFMKNSKLELYEEHIARLQRQIENECSIYLSTITSGKDIEQVSFCIYQYITAQLAKDDLVLNFDDVWNKVSGGMINKKLIGELEKESQKIFRIKLNSTLIADKFDEIMENFREAFVNKEFKERIVLNSQIYSDQISAAKQAIHRILINSYKGNLATFKNVPSMFLTASNSKKSSCAVKCDSFYFERELSDCPEYKDIIKLCRIELENRLQSLGLLHDKINLKEFLTYHSDHSKYDHGIVGACILTSFYTIYKLILDNIETYPMLCAAWPSSKTNLKHHVTKKNDIIMLDAIFAILVHNIYPSIYKGIMGISFMHEINTNPFSYFCAFCDSLQVWDRHQQIDQSFATLKPTGYYGSRFDLEVNDKKIMINGETKDIEASKKKLTNDLDAYLQDASKFILLSLRSNW